MKEVYLKQRNNNNSIMIPPKSTGPANPRARYSVSTRCRAVQISQATKEKAESIKTYIKDKYNKKAEEGKVREIGFFSQHS